LSILYGRDYSVLTEYNGRIYIQAINFTKKGDKNTSGFKKLVLDDSLQVLEAEPNKVTKLSYPFEKHTFINSIEPKTTTSHASVIKSLFAEPPKKITKKSVIGDLVKIRMIFREGAGDFLRERGFIDDDFLSLYSPEPKGDLILVSLAGVRDMLAHYRDMHSKPAIEQNIYMETTYQPSG
jgi:hypothetical protein